LKEKKIWGFALNKKQKKFRRTKKISPKNSIKYLNQWAKSPKKAVCKSVFLATVF